MKAYGLPRTLDLECPDLADIHYYGLKSSKSSILRLGGDRHNSFRSPIKKRITRRYWKKAYRASVKIVVHTIEYGEIV